MMNSDRTTHLAAHLDKSSVFKRICFFGMFGMGNYGNDASLEAMLSLLRRILPAAEFSCVCVGPSKVGAAYQIATIDIGWRGFSNPLLQQCDRFTGKLGGRLANWFRAVWHLRNVDAMIIPGTSTLCDYRANPFGAPYALFRWSVAARLAGAKLCFVCTGAGPIHRRPSRWMLSVVARLANYRSFRDQSSKDVVLSWGIDTRADKIFPDLVFNLPLPKVDQRLQGGATTIGLGVMDYTGWQGQRSTRSEIYETYLGKLVRLAKCLLDRGYVVRLLIGESSDRRAVSDLQIALRREGYPTAMQPALVVEPICSLRDVLHQILQTDIVVASRYHNVVGGLMLRRPTISLGYEAKHKELMCRMGLEGFCHDVESFDPVAVADQTDRLKSQINTRSAGLGDHLAGLQAQFAQLESELLETLNK